MLQEGYLVPATSADDTHAETAIDASTSWTRFPRMGYLSHFKPAAPDGLADNATYEPYLFHAPSDYVTKLSQDYHLNALVLRLAVPPRASRRHRRPQERVAAMVPRHLRLRCDHQHLRDQGRRGWRH